MNIDFSNIGKRLQVTRIENNITQKEMADSLKIPMDYINNLENGKVNIELQFFMSICDYLHISIFDVLNEKTDNKMMYMDKELYELIIKCSFQKQKLIYNMVKLLIKNQVV